MFIADHLNGRIREITTDGFVSTVAGTGDGGPTYGTFTPGVGPAAGDGGPATHGVLGCPWALTVDSHGNLFIADRDHAAIRKVHTNGIITTVAGTGVKGFSGDGGLATQAKLNRPLTVAFDAAGNMFIDDENNRRIRMVDHTLATSPRSRANGNTAAVAMAAKRSTPRSRIRTRSALRPTGRCWSPTTSATTSARSPRTARSRRLRSARASSCKNLVGVDVSHLPVGAYTFGPDGELYLSVCNRIIRVDNNGITHLFARAPLMSNLPKP